jgi:hypothetical protein
MRESLISRNAWNLPARPVRGVATCALAVTILSLMLLSVAIWNRFPLIFYDTGGYVLEGLGHVFLVERAPVYAELLFLSGARFSLWPVVILQALMASTMILEVARAEVPRLTLGGFVSIGAVLCLLTGIAWYAGQVEPDIFTPMVILGAYLLLFRSDRLGRASLLLVMGITSLAVATHPSHLGLMGGLLFGAALLRLVARRNPIRPNLRRGLIGLIIALGLIVAGNFVLTGKFFISKSGSVFVLARLMQDGIVQRLMSDTCPPKGNMDWRLCAYKDRIPKTAEAWLWGEGSSFRALGGFKSEAQQEEGRRIVWESVKRYPFMHLRKAVRESLYQFFWFKTGDGVEPQQSVLGSVLKRLIPAQMPAYLEARQQRARFHFKTLNLIHMPVAAMSILGLLVLLRHAVVRRGWNEGLLPAMVLLGLIGNAIICGTFSNPHDRYQSRIVWLPSLVLLLAVTRDRRALQPVAESGT